MTRKSISSKTRRAAVVAAGGLVIALGGMTPQASAADDEVHWMRSTPPFPWEDPGASVWFQEYGDKVTLCDTAKDGAAAVLSVEYPETVAVYRMKEGGKGNCDTYRAGDGGSHDLREGRTYTFRVCTTSGECNIARWKNDH
jgi:hypothetical protein